MRALVLVFTAFHAAAAPLTSVTASGNVTGVDVSADGAWLAVLHEAKGGGAQVDVYPLAGGKPTTLPALTDGAGEVSFVDGGRLVAVGTYKNKLHVWSAADGKVVLELDLSARPPAGGRLEIAGHPTRPLVAWSVTDDHTGDKPAPVEVVEVPSGKTVGRVAAARAQYQARFAADGRHLLLHGEVIDPAGGKSKDAKLRGNVSALSADGMRLVTGELAAGALSVRDAAGGAEIAAIAATGVECPNDVWFDGDSVVWSCVDYTTVALYRWDASTKKVKKLGEVKNAGAVAFDAAGRRFAIAAGKQVKLVAVK